jgi:hypothetical protein
MNVIEVIGVNLEPSMKPYRLEDRFVCYEPGGPLSEPVPHSDAVRLACGMSDQACVGFLADEPVPAPVAIDYLKPLPGILSRRKQKSPPSL